jgi:Tfp pilus assembly protein PilZ
MSDWQDRDRRINPRTTTDARCWLERESVTLLGTVTNISVSGLFMRTPVTVATGSEVKLTVNLGSGIVAVRGRVAWTSPSASAPSYTGIGICFDEVTGGENLLNQYLQTKLGSPD